MVPETGNVNDINVTITTTTVDLTSPDPDMEVVQPDNTDVDVYNLIVDVTRNPGGDLVVAAGQAGAFIPEDTTTTLTLSATVGDPTDAGERLTQITVEFPVPIDTNGSDPDQFQILDAALDPIRAMAEVVSATLADNGTTLTIVLDGSTNSFSGNFDITPPLNSDVDLSGVQITVDAVDNDSGQTASGTSNSDIVVDAIVDGSEVLQSGGVIGAGASLAGNVAGATLLGLSLTQGQDSTSLAAAPDADAPFTQGGGDTDGSETVTEVMVTLSIDPSVTLPILNFVLPAGVTVDNAAGVPQGGGAIAWTFTIPEGTSEADVSALMASLSVDRGDLTKTDDITVTVQTTTTEAATVAGPNGGSGAEASEADNVDVDTYTLTIDFLDVPNGRVLVDGQQDGFIPEDTLTPGPGGRPDGGDHAERGDHRDRDRRSADGRRRLDGRSQRPAGRGHGPGRHLQPGRRHHHHHLRCRRWRYQPDHRRQQHRPVGFDRHDPADQQRRRLPWCRCPGYGRGFGDRRDQ